MLPFGDELDAFAGELTGEADAERAFTALGEGRYGDALVSGPFAIPYVGKVPKAAKWKGQGAIWAGKGLKRVGAGSVRGRRSCGAGSATSGGSRVRWAGRARRTPDGSPGGRR